MAYATVADWPSTSPVPADLQRRLDRASLLVDEMLLTAVYDVDDSGNPTDAADIVALREATLAQAEYAAAGGDPLSVGAAQYQSMSIGSVSLTRGQTGKGGSTPGRYSPVAQGILQRRGLLPLAPYAY